MEGEKIRSNSKSYGSTQVKGATDRVVYIEHIVTPSETIAGLSVKYDVPIHNIRRANRLLMTDTLYQDMKIYIPTKYNPATLTVSEINGETLVVGDAHAPVKNNTSKRSSGPFSQVTDDSTSETSPAQNNDKNRQHQCDTEGMQRQQSMNEIFEKIDQTVTAVKGSMQSYNKDGFSASHSSSNEELFSASKPGLCADDALSNRSATTNSSNPSPRIRKVDSNGRRIASGLSSSALSFQMANDDNTDFPL